jgi:hypothetical protein
MECQPGIIGLLGSGETSLAGGRVFENIANQLPKKPLRISILETPAGFELNSSSVAGRVGEFLKNRLQNFNPQIDIVPARRSKSPFSTNDPSVLEPLLHAHLIFMGPGSPTYATRHLAGSLAWDLVRLCHRNGAALVFASAAVVAIGAHALPVYEIYKVGEDVTAVPGLDLFKDFNLHLSFIPHWNNTDGGTEVDTSRCFIGKARFEQWYKQLPGANTVLGLDEHTGLIVDFSAKNCSVSGSGSITLLREHESESFATGAVLPFSALGDYHNPGNDETISIQASEMIKEAKKQPSEEEIPEEVVQLAKEREQARLAHAWSKADKLRQKINLLGWTIDDTTSGQKIRKRSEIHYNT